MQKFVNHKKLKLLKVFLGIAITAVSAYFMVFSLKGINVAELFSQNTDWVLVSFSCVLFLLSTFIRSWAYTFGIEKDLSMIEAWQIVGIGNAANMVLPFHAGEALRLAVFPKRYKPSERAKLILIPGAVDVAFLLLISAFAVLIANFKEQYYILILRIASFGFLAFLALIFVILLLIPKTRNKVISYFNINTLNMIKWVGLSWGIMLISVWTAILAFGYDPNRSFVLTFGAMGGLNIVGMIPSSPGNIGIFEYAVTIGLLNVGIAEIEAKKIGLMLHFIQYLSLIPLGTMLLIHFIYKEQKRRVIVSFNFKSNRNRNFSK